MLDFFSMEQLSEISTRVNSLLWTSLRFLSRLNRDYNPLIHHREEPILNLKLDVCDQEKELVIRSAPLPSVVIIIAIVAITNVYRDSKLQVLNHNCHFVPLDSSGCFRFPWVDTNNNLSEYNVFDDEISDDMLQRLYNVQILLSNLPHTNQSKTWLCQIPSCIQRLVKNSEDDESAEDLSGETWDNIEEGFKAVLEALGARLDQASRSVSLTEMVDKGVQVNFEKDLCVQQRDQIYSEQLIEKATQGQKFKLNSGKDTQLQEESVAKSQTKNTNENSRCPIIDLSSSEVPTKAGGSTLNIQIEFDRNVYLGNLN
ncbi:uncharacterized protein TNIN_217621 [Trichonephila inaurata madagascariensis]|uniref:Uncharacterized protein n=1 Tax=Trichonephila inaurata madagascariensis TaxID=2747483 RepID=A0A8X6YCD0_9ARAC|nr:uncharacterized protein TNIN_217621 [Trichonephila inaurata madagascariensis]